MIAEDNIDLSGTDVIFEITRFCNMECPHCIRGEAQRLRIKKLFIDLALSQFDYIGTITFSGGEPALAVDLIKYTLEQCRNKSIEVGNFWVATNGTIAKTSFFNVIKDWLNYCSDNEISGLRVSIDQYHDDIYTVDEFEYLKEEINNWIAPNFYLELSGAPNESRYLISDGRAAWNYAAGRSVEHGIRLFSDGHLEGALYINARGYVITTCDISYDSMDESNSEFVLCHVTDNIRAKLAEWFNAHPDRIYDD